MFRKPLIKYRVPRVNRKLLSLRNSVRFIEAKNIGILFCSDTLEKHQAVKRIIAELEGLGKQVDVLTYLGKGKDNHEFLFKYFTKKDFNMWGRVENSHITDFVNKEFDFVLCFDFQTNLYMKYILSASHAKCRIGYLEEEAGDYFELMVKSKSKTIQDLIDTIKQYTFSLN